MTEPTTRTVPRGRRRGFAVPIVLILALVFAITGSFILLNTKQHNRQNLTAIEQLQAHFLARAGLEMAMVKIKYLHRQLYDAACLAQGRNPLYDFRRDPAQISPVFPGPCFLYRSGDAVPTGFYTASSTMLARFPNCYAWLETFRSDIQSGVTLDTGPVNQVMSLNDAAQIYQQLIVPRMREPYRGQYLVESLDLAAQQITDSGGAGSVVRNEAVVEFVVRATLTPARDPLRSWEETLRRTVTVARETR